MDTETQLTDPFGRTIDYLRVSITDRCDLRCSYCLPKNYKGGEREPDEWLTFDELERLVRAFTELGTRHVRITGGEPLVRRGAADLVRRLAALPQLEDLSLSTNCTRMARYAETLKAAGLDRLNISLDSLDPERFAHLTGGRLDKVVAGILAAKAAGFTPIRLNMVVMRGVNDDEIEPIMHFCAEHGFTLRLIETMPMGQTGQAAVDQYVDLQQVREALEQKYHLAPEIQPGGGPARYYRIEELGLSLGLITPISQHFCETCNRVRLTADGTLHLCLGQENSYSFRQLLRDGCSNSELKLYIAEAISKKPERHEFREKPGQVVRFMATTGG